MVHSIMLYRHTPDSGTIPETGLKTGKQADGILFLLYRLPINNVRPEPYIYYQVFVRELKSSNFYLQWNSWIREFARKWKMNIDC